MSDESGHRGIEPIPLFQLQAQAFGQGPGSHAGRIESMDDLQHTVHPDDGDAEPVSDLVERLRQVAALVHGVDQAMADQPVDRIRDGEQKLVRQMIVKRRQGCDIALEARAVPLGRRWCARP